MKAFSSAYKCLDDIFRKQAFSNIHLNEILEESDPKDKPLITKIVYGVLDNNIGLEYIIGNFGKSIKPAIMTILKIGVFCLKYLSIPSYAVINDCVDLTKEINKKQLAGFVNATLRNIDKAINEGNIPLPKQFNGKLSVKYSCPLWVVNKLLKAHGNDFTEQFLAYQPIHATHVRLRQGVDKQEFLALLDKKKVKYEKSPMPNSYYIYGSLTNVDNRKYTIQSIGSMMVCNAVGFGSQKVLDLCSAPGGKAVYLAETGAQVTACDIYEHRVNLIDSYAKRMNVKLVTMQNDATVYNESFDSSFDAVLCDAPCSGFGVYNSKPDIKLFRTEQTVIELSRLQKQILDTACRYVKKGGSLIYSTCTVFEEENSKVIDEFLSKHSDFSLQKFTLPVVGIIEGEKQFYPHIDNIEGYFIAKMERK